MKNKRMVMGMLVMALVCAMTVLSACGSSAYATIKDPITPDDQSAIVYFIGNKNSGTVWDGETPIGDFDEVFFANMAWKTTPGIHYFMVNTFNWVVMKADLEANKHYFLKIESIPNPVPFAKDIIALRIIKPEDGEAWLRQVKTVSFTDKWRADFAKGKQLKEAMEHLREAQNDQSMEIDLTGIHGR